METQQPLGQPINADPNSPQYVPQPLQTNGPVKSSKKIWLIIAGAVGLLLILGLAYWFMGKSATEQYKKDAATYKQQITQVRDDMNTVLDEQNISIRSPKGPPVFEEYGKKMQDVVAGAPKEPKVFGFLPVSGTSETKKQVEDLSRAAGNYAGELRHIYTLFSYFTTVVEKFKPVKDLGNFTVKDVEKIKSLPGLWETFLVEYKALSTPAGLESLREDIIAQGEALLAEFKTLANGFDQRTQTENDTLVKNVRKPTENFNATFQKSLQDSSNAAIDKVNTYYDELDELLQ